jgi:hypothetical protein
LRKPCCEKNEWVNEWSTHVQNVLASLLLG